MKFLVLLMAFMPLILANVAKRNVPMVKMDFDMYQKGWAKYVNGPHGLNGAIQSTSDKNRTRIFETNVEIINEHNIKYNLGQVNHTFGITVFTAWTTEEFKNFVSTGARESNESIKTTAPTKKGNLIRHKRKRLPRSFNWVDHGYVTPVKNQFKCGSCSFFSAVAAIEGQYAKLSHKLVSFSEQYLMDCGRLRENVCEGVVVENVFKFLMNTKATGLPGENSYPYKAVQSNCERVRNAAAFKVTGFQYVENDDESIVEAVVNVGVLNARIFVSDNFQHYTGGVIQDPGICSTKMNHAVNIVGYDSESYILKNSWSEEWGEEGYFRIARGNCEFDLTPFYPQLATLNENNDDEEESEKVKKLIPIKVSKPTNDEFRFTIKNDDSSKLKIYWIDWKKTAKLYSTIKKGGSATQDSYINHVWVLVNESKKTCLTFELGVTKGFGKTDSEVNVSDLADNKCDLVEFNKLNN